MKVEFAFKLFEKVVTPFGVLGMVSMLAFDDGGKKYFIKTEFNNDWFNEEQLRVPK